MNANSVYVPKKQVVLYDSVGIYGLLVYIQERYRFTECIYLLSDAFDVPTFVFFIFALGAKKKETPWFPFLFDHAEML